VSDYSHQIAHAFERLGWLMDRAEQLGPSRRERIATAAMQGMLASDQRHENAQAGVLAGEAWTTAALALQLADALIAQLDKEPTTNPAERGTEGTEA